MGPFAFPTDCNLRQERNGDRVFGSEQIGRRAVRTGFGRAVTSANGALTARCCLSSPRKRTFANFAVCDF